MAHSEWIILWLTVLHYDHSINTDLIQVSNKHIQKVYDIFTQPHIWAMQNLAD